MKSKAIKPYSDSNSIKGILRHALISHVIGSNSWSDMKVELKKYNGNNYKKNASRLFSEFKFYNIILNVEYHITDSLNRFLVKENKIKDWKKLENEFAEKVKKNMKTKDKDEAKKILKNETDGEKEMMLTPSIMFNFAGFGLGELINYINEFTISFSEKKKLIKKLTEFNESRKVIIHRILSSRENVEEKIEDGILKGKESADLIDKIINYARTDL